MAQRVFGEPPFLQGAGCAVVIELRQIWRATGCVSGKEDARLFVGFSNCCDGVTSACGDSRPANIKAR